MRTTALLRLFFLSNYCTAWLSSTSRRRCSHLPPKSTVLALSSSSPHIIGSSTTTTEEDENSYRLRFRGVARLYDSIDEDESILLDRLRQSSVTIIGIGGVGSWAAEALCRSGIGSLTLVDLDDICISNTNRQLHATLSSVGRMKVDEMKRRLLDINPDCNVTTILDFVTADNVHDILLASTSTTSNTSVVLDAMDGGKEKAALIAACTDLKLPVVTCGAAAGRVDPTSIVIDDLARVEGDKLLASCRKDLRKYHAFKEGMSFREKQNSKRKVQKWNIPCVYSLEEQKQLRKGQTCSFSSSSLRRCDGALGTACFVTGTYGFVAASCIVSMIARNELVVPRR